MSFSNPLVSLITGCYNGERFIDRAFNSIVEQSYRPIELIFVNDGSEDESLQKAKSYLDKFKENGIHCIIIDQQNQGSYSTSGIKQASGKYITLLDIDDHLMPDSIKERVTFLEYNDEYVAVRTNGYEVNENDIEDTTRLFVVNEAEKNNENIFEDLLFGRTNNWAGTYMVRSSVLFECYPNHIVPLSRFGQNLQILMPVAFRGKVKFIDKPLMKYIRNTESLTLSKKTFENQIALYEGFKSIRLSILKLLNIDDLNILQSLDELYLNVFLDLAFTFKKKEEFNLFYSKILRAKVTNKIKYHIINENTVRTLFYKILNKFWKI